MHLTTRRVGSLLVLIELQRGKAIPQFEKRQYVSDIPRLKDNSAVASWTAKLYGAVVIHLSDSKRSKKARVTKLSGLVLRYLYRVTDMVFMRSATRILSLVILPNAVLLATPDVMPISLIADVHHGITTKHQLHRSGIISRMDRGAHSEGHRSEDFRPVATGEILKLAYIVSPYHVTERLVRPLDHSIGLWVMSCNCSAGYEL